MSSEKLRDEEMRALERQGAGRESLVPASYAEKAMSSLLRLHEDLVEEKERRIDLYRRLMEREQSLAEMRAYVKLLEGELARRGFDPTAYALDPVEAPPPTMERYRAVAEAAGQAVPGAGASGAGAPRQQGRAAAGPSPAAQASASGAQAAAKAPRTSAAHASASSTPQASTPHASTASAPARGEAGGKAAGGAPAAEQQAAGRPGPGPVLAWTPASGKIGAIR